MIFYGCNANPDFEISCSKVASDEIRDLKTRLAETEARNRALEETNQGLQMQINSVESRLNALEANMKGSQELTQKRFLEQEELVGKLYFDSPHVYLLLYFAV